MTNTAKESLRLFYALWPDDMTRAALMDLQAPLSGRKTRYENLHLTLAFLGQQSIDLLPLFKSILEKLPQHAIALTVDRIGYFTRKKIAWAGMHAIPTALTALHKQLVADLVQNNVPFSPPSEFHPHITLARDADMPEELPFHPFVWQCQHAVLVASTNQQDGVAYRVLASHPLMQGEASASGWIGST